MPYTTIAGTWGFAEVNECAEDPRDFVFSRDGKRMSAVHKGLAEAGDGDLRSRFEYKVLAATPESLHVALEGETRLDESGQPVTWDLVVFDTNTLRWRRSDWPQDEFTSELVRCEI